MSDKSNLYVFAKKEVALIFLFMFVIAITSFVLGVKMGKEHAYMEAKVTPQDQARVEMLSGEEERAEQAVRELEKKDASNHEDDAALHERLRQHIDTQLESPGEPKKVSQGEQVASPQQEPAPQEQEGKYTIQLGSHRSRSDAQRFAQGFEVRGYRPIIREVAIPGRGVWFRVSIGRFESVAKAKEYIAKEKGLFQGEDYHISPIEK